MALINNPTKYYPCQHCYLVYKSQGALTRHHNQDHWDKGLLNA